MENSKEDIRAFAGDATTIPAAKPKRKAKERVTMYTGMSVSLKEFPGYVFNIRSIQRGSIMIEPIADGKTSRMLVEELTQE